MSRLTFIGETGTSSNSGYRLANYMCSCGNTIVAPIAKVNSGRKMSCGCLQRETRESFGEGRKLPKGEAYLRGLYARYKKSAQRRGLVFDIEETLFRQIISLDCHYCGSRPSLGFRVRQINGVVPYNGLDRYDNNKGYLENNVVPCCVICNRIKTNMDVNEMYEHISKMLDMWKRTA